MPAPPNYEPMLATTGALPSPAQDPQWAYEVKWDGVRAIVAVHDGTVRMVGRRGADYSPRYPELAGLADDPGLGGRSAVLDGEVVALTEDARPSFELLQRRMHIANPLEAQALAGVVPVTLMLFDLLWFDGTALVSLPWDQRRDALDALALAGPHWHTPPAWRGGGRDLVAATKAQNIEGIVAKRRDSPYLPGQRSATWLKIKNINLQDCVVGGWVSGDGGRAGRLGALCLGIPDPDAGGKLRWCGKVGTGFTNATLSALEKALAGIATDESPYAGPVPERHVHFVEPVLVASVEYREWTRIGTMRHPSFKGLRADMDPKDVRREAAEPSP